MTWDRKVPVIDKKITGWLLPIGVFRYRRIINEGFTCKR